MSQVGIRALKQNASEVVRQAAAGDVITITDHGTPVAQIVPLRKSRYEEMKDAGLIREAKIKPWELPPPRQLPEGSRPISDVLQEMRDEERY